MANLSLDEITTKHTSLLAINKQDAQVIISLRNSRADSVLHDISSSIELQNAYYEKYLVRKNSGDEVYYKVVNFNEPKQAWGLVRLTQLNTPDIFSWESFIISKEAPSYIAYDAMLALYYVGFLTLNKKVCGPWGIPKAGENVYKFHQQVGMAEKIGEDVNQHLMIVKKENYLKKSFFYSKLGLGNVLNLPPGNICA